MDEASSALPTAPAARRRPVALLCALALTSMAAIAAAGYAGWMGQQRELLQAQVAQSERKVLDLREQLTRAEIAVQEKEASLATRDAALAQATQPELPVRVSFRPAWMGQGMVATVRNVTTGPLSLMVEVRDPGAHRSKAFALDINSGGSADIGHAQGWLVTSGQSIKVAASGYRSVMAFAP